MKYMHWICAVVGMMAAASTTTMADGVLPKVSDPMLAASVDQRIGDLQLEAATAAKVRLEYKRITNELNEWDKTNGKQVAKLQKDLAKARKDNDQASVMQLDLQLWKLIDQRDLLEQEKLEPLLEMLTPEQQEYWLTQDMYASTLAGASLTGATMDRAAKVKMMGMATTMAGAVVVLNKRSDKSTARDRYNDQRSKQFQDREKKRQADKDKKKEEKKQDPDPLAPLVPPDPPDPLAPLVPSTPHKA